MDEYFLSTEVSIKPVERIQKRLGELKSFADTRPMTHNEIHALIESCAETVKFINEGICTLTISKHYPCPHCIVLKKAADLLEGNR